MKSNHKLNGQQSVNILLGKAWFPRKLWLSSDWRTRTVKYSSEINPFRVKYCPTLLAIEYIVINKIFNKVSYDLSDYKFVWSSKVRGTLQERYAI